jgi:Rieske Fe-S protein
MGAYLVWAPKVRLRAAWALLARPTLDVGRVELLMSQLGDQKQPQESSAVTRRTVLRAAGLLGLTGAGAAALGACAEASSGSPSASPAVQSTPPETSPPASPSPTAPERTPGSTAKAPTGPNVAMSRVPVGGGVILENADYVITQPTKGEFKAFSNICTHQGCPVASVSNGVIHCNCHGSEYSIEDGSVTNPPAPKPLAEAKTTVFKGKIYVTS